MSYLQLIGRAGDVAEEHELLFSLQIDAKRPAARRAITRLGGGDLGALAVLAGEVGQLIELLDEAAITVTGLLTRAGLAAAIRAGYDPWGHRQRQRQLEHDRAQRSGDRRRTPPAPTAREEHWGHVAVDGALHCTLWVAEWPRIDVRALFLQPLLMDTRVTRSVAMVMELVGPARATRHAERAATERATEQSLRARVGQRTSQTPSASATAPPSSASASSPRATPPSATPPTSPSARPTRPRRRRRARGRRQPRRARGQARAAAPRAHVGPAGRRRSPTPCPSAEASVSRATVSAAPARAERRDERAARAEQRVAASARQPRALAAADAAAAAAARGPGERSAHQVSTAHFQAAYPAVAEPGLGARGVYIGRDMHGGSFVYDPWVLYAAGVLNDANMLVIGRPGHGKSALVKSWMYRSRVFGRTCELIDPKGEYAPLVRALGGEVLTLHAPAAQTRLNPLTRLGSREMREGLLEAIARAMLDRPLTQPEALGLPPPWPPPTPTRRRRGRLHPRRRRRSCATPPKRSPAARVHPRGGAGGPARVRARVAAAHATARCAGMFDQPTRASEQVWDAPAVCLDLSQVGVGQAQSEPRGRDRDGLRVRVP